MLQSIIVYTLTALCLYLLARYMVYKEQNKKLDKENDIFWFSWEFILSVLIFAVVSGLRYEVGADYGMYLSLYEDYRLNGILHRDTLEPAFVFIIRLFGEMNLHYSVFFGFWAALQIGFIYYAFRHNKKVLPYIAVCFILGPYFLSCMNGIRQMVVACIFVFSVEFIQKRQFWYFLTVVLLSAMIHKSAIFLLPLYFILNLNIDFPNKKTNYILLGLFVLLGMFPYWISILKFTFGVLEQIGYGAYITHLNEVVSGNFTPLNWGPGRISLFVIDLIIIWYYPFIKQYYKSESNSIRLYFIMFFVGACSYQLLADASSILLRPLLYLTIFKIPLSAFLLCYFKDSNKKVYFYSFLLLVCSNLYISVLKAGLLSLPENNVLYNFFWNCV